MGDGGAITQLLRKLNQGNESAADQLYDVIYPELRALANNAFRQFRPGQTMQPTALAHEAYLRLVASAEQQWENRGHFLAVAAKAMRHVLLDYVRNRNAQKRGAQAWRQITLDEALAAIETQTVDVLTLDETLCRLAALHGRQAQLVEMRVFGGMTIDEAAEALGVSRTTVKSDWLIARAWLRKEVARQQAV